MAIVAQFPLSGAANDISGNNRNGTIVGSGPTFTRNDPVSPFGGACAKSFSDANYITLPASIFTGMQDTGSLQYTFYYGKDDAITKIALWSSHGGNGVFRIEWSSYNQFNVLWPSTTGVKVTWSEIITLRPGRWYTFLVSWTPTSFVIRLFDVAMQTTEVMVNVVPDGYAPAFSTPDQPVLLGRLDSAGYAHVGAICNVVFYNTEITEDVNQYKTIRLFATFGHSWCEGAQSTTHDGYRLTAHNLWKLNKKAFNFCGVYQWGDIPCAYTNGVSGHTAAQVLSDLESHLATVIPNPNEMTPLIFGPVELTDTIYKTDLEIFATNYEACLDYINAYSNQIRMYIVSQNPAPIYGDTSPYTAVVRSIVSEKIAAGYNMVFLDAASHISVEIGADECHPSDTGYISMGTFIGKNIIWDIFGLNKRTNFRKWGLL